MSDFDEKYRHKSPVEIPALAAIPSILVALYSLVAIKAMTDCTIRSRVSANHVSILEVRRSAISPFLSALSLINWRVSSAPSL